MWLKYNDLGSPLTSFPCSSNDGGFSITMVCVGLAGCMADGPAPPPLAPGGGPPPPCGFCEEEGPAPAPPTGVTKWHTEHLTHDALTGYMSMMAQPPHTRC